MNHNRLILTSHFVGAETTSLLICLSMCVCLSKTLYTVLKLYYCWYINISNDVNIQFLTTLLKRLAYSEPQQITLTHLYITMNSTHHWAHTHHSHLLPLSYDLPQQAPRSSMFRPQTHNAHTVAFHKQINRTLFSNPLQNIYTVQSGGILSYWFTGKVVPLTENINKKFYHLFNRFWEGLSVMCCEGVIEIFRNILEIPQCSYIFSHTIWVKGLCSKS